MSRKRRGWPLSDLESGLLAVGGVALGVMILRPRAKATTASVERNPGVPLRRPAQNGFQLPRPLRRAKPRLRVVDGGAQTTTLPAVRQEADPFDRLLVELFDGEPRGGCFYPLREGDTPETVARAVLSKVGRFTRQNVYDYIHCFSSSRFNLDRYGSTSTSRPYRREWMVPVLGLGLRAAFLHRNADAIEAIAHHRLPRRTVDRDGRATDPDAQSLGVIWLPPVSREELARGVVTCGHQTYADGSSSIEPPPEFLAHLEVAA